jgi:hypothetical protein
MVLGDDRTVHRHHLNLFLFQLIIEFGVPGESTVLGCDLCQTCQELTFPGGTDFSPHVRLIGAQLPGWNTATLLDAYEFRTGCLDSMGAPHTSYQMATESNMMLALEAWPTGGFDPKMPTAFGDMAYFVSVPDSPEGITMPLQLLEPVELFDPSDPT